MPISVTPLADAESLVRGWLQTQFDPARVVTELPANLADVAPVILVGRLGGSSPLITMDNARIDVTTFDVEHDGFSARENSRSLAGRVRAAILYHLPGQVAGGGAVQSVDEESAPHYVPYDNTNLRRFEATYRITIHSVPA